MAELAADDPRFVGGYRLLSRLGVGGMGRVYLARSGGGRTVAVKLVKEELAAEQEFRVRFRQEVEAAGRVGGTWTAPVLDADTEASTPWVATGYIAGPSLEHVVSGSRDDGTGYGPLPAESVRMLAYGLSSALADIHRAGLVHRDLKPSNVLLTIDGPRVIDFGIARALESVSEATLTRTGMVVGSPAYMSPEQLRGERLSAAADVFSMGSVLAYAATGRPPFGNGAGTGGVHAVMFRVAAEEPDLDGVEEPLRGLIASCLAKEPALRPGPAETREQVEPLGEGAAPPLWLPPGLLADLGRQAVRLLDTDTPPDGSRASAWPETGVAPSSGAAERKGAHEEEPAGRELSVRPAESAPQETPEPLTVQLPSGTGEQTAEEPRGERAAEGAPEHPGGTAPSAAQSVPTDAPSRRTGLRARIGRHRALASLAGVAVVGVALYAGFTATGSPHVPFTGVGESADHSADAESDASDVPSEYLGTWTGPIEVGGGRTGGYRKFVITKGNVGDVVVDSVTLGEKYSCWSDGRLIQASGSSGLRLDTKVVRSLPEGLCTALGEHTLRLDKDGDLHWRAASRSSVLERLPHPERIGADFLGTWQRPLPSGGVQHLTVRESSTEDGGVGLVSDGPEQHCVAKAQVFSPDGGGEPLRLAPPAVDAEASDDDCRPGTSSALTVEGGELTRSFPDGTTRTYTR